MTEFWTYYMVVISLAAFVLCAYDKYAARSRRKRIPETTLFLAAFLGGAPAFFIGMLLFHHKTRHWYFKWGMPLIAAVQLALVYFIFWK